MCGEYFIPVLQIKNVTQIMTSIINNHVLFMVLGSLKIDL